jgi:hypothetical protein
MNSIALAHFVFPHPFLFQFRYMHLTLFLPLPTVFRDVVCNYPRDNISGTVFLGQGVLQYVLDDGSETVFQIQRMKCWRTYTVDDGVEMEFEYFFEDTETKGEVCCFALLLSTPTHSHTTHIRSTDEVGEDAVRADYPPCNVPAVYCGGAFACSRRQVIFFSKTFPLSHTFLSCFFSYSHAHCRQGIFFLKDFPSVPYISLMFFLILSCTAGKALRRPCDRSGTFRPRRQQHTNLADLTFLTGDPQSPKSSTPGRCVCVCVCGCGCRLSAMHPLSHTQPLQWRRKATGLRRRRRRRRGLA